MTIDFFHPVYLQTDLHGNRIHHDFGYAEAQNVLLLPPTTILWESKPSGTKTNVHQNQTKRNINKSIVGPYLEKYLFLELLSLFFLFFLRAN